MSIALEPEPDLHEARESPRRHSPRHRLRARAATAILSGFALFVGLQLGAAVVIEEWPELRDPVFEIKYRRLTRLLCEHSPPPATVVFLGSSMSANGIKADMIDEPLSKTLGRPAIG